MFKRLIPAAAVLVLCLLGLSSKSWAGPLDVAIGAGVAAAQAVPTGAGLSAAQPVLMGVGAVNSAPSVASQLSIRSAPAAAPAAAVAAPARR